MTPQLISIDPGRRALTGLVGLSLLLCGVLLTIRPLTSLMSSAIIVGVGVGVGVGVLVAARAGALRLTRPMRVVVVSAAALAGIGALVFRSNLIQLFPFFLSAGLVARALWLVIDVVRKRGGISRRASGVGYAAGCIVFSVLAWQWPDVASIAIGVAYAVTTAVLGSILVVAAIRPHRTAHATRREHPVLRAVGAGLLFAMACVLAYGSWTLNSYEVRPDEFYTWSGGIPSEPGTVLRSSPYEGTIPSGAHAVRVLYSTSYSDGSPALASAVVAYSQTPAGGNQRPVLAWQHGTTGVTQTCAPSLGKDALAESAIPGINRAIDEGWVVVATDYPGQGTAGRYPYLIGEGEGRATLDAIRAAHNLSDAHASNAAWLWGHSQGGHATLWAAQIAEAYAPEIRIIGVAALSAASDPLALARHITKSSGPLSKVITSMVLVPYSEEYEDVDLYDVVHPAGLGIVGAFAGRCTISPQTLVSVLVGTALKVDAPLYKIDLAAGAAHERLQDNIATGIVPAPLFLGQGTDDEVIPIAMQRDLSASLCTAGRIVQVREYPGLTHMGVVSEGSPLINDLFDWAHAILQGEPPNSCDTVAG